MTKVNPNRQELIQFINEMTPELEQKLSKVEDLGTGVHYLHLLHQMHPEVVKLARVNAKAFQEYENINNIKLLAQYLSQLKAPFSFDVMYSQI
jgi:EAL domain-containing protein (putative c-di-GMP-specific phosphodiesterase class I)